MAAIDAAITELRDLPGATLPILHAIQERLGFVPAVAVARVADALNLSHAEVHGVVSFYHDFLTSPPGRHVLKLCRAEACQAMGSERLETHLREVHGLGMHDTSADGAVTLLPVYCLGNCALSPSAMLDGKLMARVDARRLDSVLAECRSSAGGRA